MSGPSGSGQVLESTIAMILSLDGLLEREGFCESCKKMPNKNNFNIKIRDILLIILLGLSN